MGDPSEVRCSVIVPCRDAGATLARQLDALLAQESPVPFEIIVADNGSSDDSRRIAVERAPRVRLADASHRAGINVARNAGIRAARGELLLLCDADDEVHPGWLGAYWAAYTSGLSLLGGALRRTTSDGRPLGWQRDLNDDLEFLPWPTGANCGLARTVLDDVGFFDETLRGGADETDFFWRAQLQGHALGFVEEAAIDYVARSTTSGTFRQATAFGRSHTVLFARYRTAGMPRSHAVQDVLIWLRMLKSLVVTRLSESSRIRIVRYSGVLWGRIKGSMEHRVFYV